MKYKKGRKIRYWKGNKRIREFWERTQVILENLDVRPSAASQKCLKQHRKLWKAYYVQSENVAHLHLPPRHLMVGSKCTLWIATKLAHILKQGIYAISRYRNGTWQRTGYTRKGVHLYESKYKFVGCVGNRVLDNSLLLAFRNT